TLALDEICRAGARRMLAAALEAERDAYLASFVDERDEDGRRLVVGNGHARPRVIATGAGPIEVETPRVNDRRVDEATGERERFAGRSLADVDYVYCWADGVHFNVRLEEERLCCLVIVGVRADGTKELVAIADGYRESTGSWEDLLRDTKRRGMRAPVVMVGD